MDCPESGKMVFSLSPVRRGEGRGEGCGKHARRSQRRIRRCFSPSPQPSPLSIGEREPQLRPASVLDGSMLLQTNSYIVPKDRRSEHTRLLRRFRQTLTRLGAEHFEVYEQVGANFASGE